MEGLRCPLCGEYFFEESSYAIPVRTAAGAMEETLLHAYTCYRCQHVLHFAKPLKPGRELGDYVSFILPDYDEETPRLLPDEESLPF